MSEQEYFNVADIFGENVFNDAVMQERLPKKVYKKLHEVMDEGKELDLETADVIAHEMKEWAIEKGATHYTHWFQPLTGVTAEKHDSFITSPMPNGKVLMSFSGKELIRVSRMLHLSHQVVFVLHLRQEDIQPGIVHHLHLSDRMQQAQHFAFQQPSVHTQARLLIRRHLFLDQWKQSTIRH